MVRERAEWKFRLFQAVSTPPEVPSAGLKRKLSRRRGMKEWSLREGMVFSLVSWTRTISGEAESNSERILPHLIESFRPLTFQLQTWMLLFIVRDHYTIQQLWHKDSRTLPSMVHTAPYQPDTRCTFVDRKHHYIHTSGGGPSTTTIRDKIGA